VSADRILIERLTFDCIVGVLPQERTTPQPLIIDLVLETDIRVAAASCALAYTVDYGTIAATVRDFVTNGRFLLLETLAESTAALLLEDERITAVEFTVRKPRAIEGATAAGVHIHRRR
jgi:dihydroneopterin aldolase